MLAELAVRILPLEDLLKWAHAQYQQVLVALAQAIAHNRQHQALHALIAPNVVSMDAVTVRRARAIVISTTEQAQVLLPLQVVREALLHQVLQVGRTQLLLLHQGRIQQHHQALVRVVHILPLRAPVRVVHTVHLRQHEVQLVHLAHLAAHIVRRVRLQARLLFPIRVLLLLLLLLLIQVVCRVVQVARVVREVARVRVVQAVVHVDNFEFLI